MPFGVIGLSLISFPFLFSAPAWAIDPFTIVAVGAQAVSTVESIAGVSQEAAETASALSVVSELAAEIDSDSGDEESDHVSERLRETERLALEAGYTREELTEILSEPRDSSGELAATLSKMTRSVRLAKRLAALAGISTRKAAEVAQVEQSHSLNEEKRILSRIHGQLVRTELERTRERLKREKQVRDEIGKLQRFAASVAPRGNLLLFPASREIVRKAIEVFRTYSGYLLVLVALIFVGRIIYYEFSFAPPERYGDLIKDAFVCFFLMLVFPTLYGYLAEFSDALAAKLGATLQVAGALPLEPKRGSYILPWWLQPAMIQAGAYLIVYTIFNLILAVLIALGPIAVLAGTLLNFSISLPAYLAALILIWLWPVVWNVVGYFAGVLWIGRDWTASGIVEAVAAILFWVFQILSPWVLYKHASRTQLGQAVQGAVRGVAASPAAAGRAARMGKAIVMTKVVGPAVAAEVALAKKAGGALVPGRARERSPAALTGNARF